jgi:predicted RNA-binding Zn ribbon-like protein
VTVDTGDHDHLSSAPDAVRYLVDHHVEVPPGEPRPRDLAELVEIREMARGLVDPSAGWSRAARRIVESSRYRIDPEGGLVAIGESWSAFTRDLAMPLLELVRLRDRLRICGNPVCRLVFLDGSKSGTRRWCDDAGCGNRHRVNRHRRAARTGAQGTVHRAAPRARAAPPRDGAAPWTRPVRPADGPTR